MQSRWILHPTLQSEYEQAVSNHGVVHASGKRLRDSASATAIESQWPTHLLVSHSGTRLASSVALGAVPSLSRLSIKACLLLYKD